MTIDLRHVRVDPIEGGWHLVEITQVRSGVTSVKQLPQIKFVSRIVDDADPDVGRFVNWSNTLEGDGLEFTARCLTAMEVDLTQAYEEEELFPLLVGKRLYVHVRQDTRNGQAFLRVNDWQPEDGDFLD